VFVFLISSVSSVQIAVSTAAATAKPADAKKGLFAQISAFVSEIFGL
jgi:hypothetical protein